MINIKFLFIYYRKLFLDLVPRVGPLAVDPHNISVVSLHQVHVKSAENAKASSVNIIKIYILSSSLAFHD